MDTFEALRLFVGIAEAGSFSAAARQHAVAPSTVTLALQQLETQAGARLITRSTRNLAFTQEGERFLADARRLLAQWQTTLDELAQGGALSGRIRITATRDFGRRMLAPLLDRFLALHPGVSVELHLGDGVVDLVGQNIDLAIRNGPLEDSSLRSRLLLRSQRVVCAAPAYWAQRGLPTHPVQLATHNCLILHRPGVPFATWPFLIDGVTTAVRVSGDRAANDGGVLRAWAEQGVGVMIKNRWEIAQELREGRLQVALDAFALPSVDLFAVFAGTTPSRRVSALIDHLAAHMAVA
ncbi:LysR family transcriptional regulator [Stenotrophomonas sp. 24(2023)]|uniref:LysR family transcriptional regulator n=1 Tax=Stenotrophomonas sp. 24(2023) TaxID=3068324 RepID=UPI0027DF9256|nr:LysR family transcriptional regulator [Stenotrophomonas sp. 24(2023)]WMJ69643.1 LysR substrate-binding domain-containing protein [Stenotrophomonas sp. 24(2023)]